MLIKSTQSRSLLMIGFLSLIYLFMTQCSYVTPEEENPVPGLENSSTMGTVQAGVLSVRKSFFGIAINDEANTWGYEEDKTWMCGWAPTKQSGKFKNFGGLTGVPYNTGHCNMVFRLTDDGSFLEAREVNVDKPNPEDWQTLFVIPVLQHYFYEKAVDSRGRELNRYAKVSNRKNWQLQPFMDLDLKRITVLNRGKGPLVLFNRYSLASSSALLDVHDVELVKETDGMNFMGFTGTMISSIFGSDIQHEVRFNFLEFKGTKGFQVTPYDANSVSRHMNILHILGTREDGRNEKNYAAHWDLREPIEVCLNGFPEHGRYKQIAGEVLEEVNRKLRKIKALKADQKGFYVSERNMKYSFDLRCPSINWVADPELSMGAPLGIGLVNTNVRTGQILWGSAIMWGGLIDSLVNRDSESPVDALVRNTHEVLSEIKSVKDSPYFTDLNHQLQLEDLENFETVATSLDFNNDDQLKESFKELLTRTAESSSLTGTTSTIGNLTQEQNQLVHILGLDEEASKIVNDHGEQSVIDQLTAAGQNVDEVVASKVKKLLDDQMSKILKDLPNQYSKDLESKYADFNPSEALYKETLFKKSDLGTAVEYNDVEKERRSSVQKDINQGELQDKIISDYKSLIAHDADWDNTVEKHYGEWLHTTSQMNGQPEREEAAYSVIKNVMLHEWGHVLGMGHQFKGNVLPERGTIPETLYETLSKDAHEHKYYSSIMDYQSGQTEVSLKAEDVKMQTQDEFVLSYLHMRKVPTFEPGETDFKYVNLPVNGSIPAKLPDENNKLRQVRYMPQCSDLEAWLATDPNCRRWDRGYDANNIVEESYNQFKDSFIKRMNSFTQATGGSANYYNWRLWSESYSLANYNRTFYDKMRFDMLDDLNNPTYTKAFLEIIDDRDSIMQFSKACLDPNQASQKYREKFSMLSLQPTALTSGQLDPKKRREGGNYSSKNRELLGKYETLMGDKKLSEMSPEEYAKFENDLYDQGVAFTEVQKLCRATSQSLDHMKTLLSLPGFDKTEIDYEGSVIPTGLRGANARAQYNKIFGRYVTLGMLPLKLANLSVLTSPSSTMRYGWWNISKPKYSGSKGNYSYSALYPEEYTDIVKTSVENNMSFGGVNLGDKATLSLANLYMSYFLRRGEFRTRDKQRRKFNDIFLSDVKGQTKFRVSLSPVLLEAIVDDEISDSIIFGFTPKIFSRAKDGLITLPEAYVLPEGEVIVRGTDGQIVMPITKLRFIGAKSAYVWAIEITYEPTRPDDPLQGFSVKSSIRTLSNKVIDDCMGNENGLASFFNKANRATEDANENKAEKFDGFTSSSNIAVSENTQIEFNRSVTRQFEKYHNLTGIKEPNQKECSESRKGLGLIGATALSLQGFILPQVFEYLE